MPSYINISDDMFIWIKNFYKKINKLLFLKEDKDKNILLTDDFHNWIFYFTLRILLLESDDWYVF